MLYIARRKENGDEQLLINHLENVACLSKDFAQTFNSGDIGYTIGLLHDIGKYSSAFQRRIRGSSERVDHSTAGAVVCEELFNKFLSLIIGYCITGHHGGLLNYGSIIDYQENATLKGRLTKTIEDFNYYKNEITVNQNLDIHFINNNIKKSNYPDFTISFYTRMLFSCLVDADFIDTEQYMNDEVKRGVIYNFQDMYKQLTNYLEKYKNLPGLINQKRQEILNECISSSKLEKGIFRLYVPTGGGKTLSSLTFAINHLLSHNLKRIIYVIPYSSIIEQTAGVFKSIFGEDKVLEHHYNFSFDYDETSNLTEEQERLKLSMENWDAPIIVTTNNQFFESFYSNKTSKCRKLHNIANSIIIFDEVQMFSYDFLKPCLFVIKELVKNYGSSVLLCSATQPNFDSIIKDIEIKDIVKNPNELFNIFKRVKVNKLGPLSNVDIFRKIENQHQVLTIVNTRKMAFNIYSLFKNDSSFCLSTLLTPNDRKRNIEEIKNRLMNNEPCQVVSTQLIEAGVDIDFPVVYRAVAGLDSIVQAAGRCNREGKLPYGEVNVFTPIDDKNIKKGHLLQGINISEVIMRQYDDIISNDAIKTYFDFAYSKNDLDLYKIIDCFVRKNNGLLLDYNFQDASDKFKLIENNQFPIIIMNEKNVNILESLKYAKFPSQYLNILQQDTVLVYEYEFKKLLNDKKIKEYIDGIFVLLDSTLYNHKTGLNIFYDDTFDTLIA